MDFRAAELFHGHFFPGNFFDDGGARDEHLARTLHHNDEVRQRG